MKKGGRSLDHGILKITKGCQTVFEKKFQPLQGAGPRFNKEQDDFVAILLEDRVIQRKLILENSITSPGHWLAGHNQVTPYQPRPVFRVRIICAMDSSEMVGVQSRDFSGAV